jgi:hypothetical protein
MGMFNAGAVMRRRRGFGDDLTTLVSDIAPITQSISAAENAPSSAAVSAATELIPLALLGFVIFLIVGAARKPRG